MRFYCVQKCQNWHGTFCTSQHPEESWQERTCKFCHVSIKQSLARLDYKLLENEWCRLRAAMAFCASYGNHMPDVKYWVRATTAKEHGFSLALRFWQAKYILLSLHIPCVSCWRRVVGNLETWLWDLRILENLHPNVPHKNL